MAKRKVLWQNEIENIEAMLSLGLPMSLIGNKYGVSRQRLYQVMTKFGIQTPIRDKKNFLRDKEPKYYWLNKMLRTTADRLGIRDQWDTEMKIRRKHAALRNLAKINA